MYCKHCGQAMDDQASFCDKCGAPVLDDHAHGHSFQKAPPAPPKKKWGRILLLGLIGLVSGFLGMALVGGGLGGDPPPPDPLLRPIGHFQTGTEREVLRETITPGGGRIVVDGGFTIDGLTIDIAPGTFTETRTFSISEAPIFDHELGRDFNPMTPLITVNTGGGYGQEVMKVTVPIERDQEIFPMAFYVSDDQKTLEGIPTILLEEDSITFGVKHFSKFVITYALKSNLDHLNVDTGFRPGVDDWQFVNYGSYLAPGGHCAGQSISSIWYYHQKKLAQGSPSLYGLYDNNFSTFTTADFWLDDSESYRLASMTQVSMNWEEESVHQYREFAYGNDFMTYYLFAYSMKLSGSPQLMGIYDEEGTTGHALVAYKIQDGSIYVADPNFPGQEDRYVVYDHNGRFSPYSSGANAAAIADNGEVAYTRFMYYANSALVNYDLMADLFTTLEQGTVGQGIFPDTSIYYNTGDQWIEVIDPSEPIETSSPVIDFQVFIEADQGSLSTISGTVPEMWDLMDQQLDRDNGLLFYYNLEEGSNQIGLLYEAVTENQWTYVDFVRLEVIHTPAIQVDEDPSVTDLGPDEQDERQHTQVIDTTEVASLTYHLTGYDLEYDYYVIQLNDDGTYELEYKKLNTPGTPYFEHGLFVNSLGKIMLERNDLETGEMEIWWFKSTNEGISLDAINYYEKDSSGNVQMLYRPFAPMDFQFVAP